MSITKHETRIQHADGFFTDILTVHFPPEGFSFEDINHRDAGQKLSEIGHFRYFKAQSRGEVNPIIVTWLRLEEDQTAGSLFPSSDPFSDQGECLLSANSLIGYHLRKAFLNQRILFENGEWGISADAPEVERNVIHWLKHTNRLHLYIGSQGSSLPKEIDFSSQEFDADRNLVPVDRCGALWDYVAGHHPILVFNTTFFLLEQEDYFSHHSALGEPFNLYVSRGVIKRPPLYRRGAIFGRANGRWQTGYFDLNDMVISIPGGMELYPQKHPCGGKAFVFSVDSPSPASVNVFTRYYGVSNQGQVLGKTPLALGALELTIVDRRIVGWKTGGGLDIPQNGFVISFSEGTLSETESQALLAALSTELWLSYSFVDPQLADIQEALQVGPLLLQRGENQLLNQDVEQAEQFWPSRILANGRYQRGLVPTDYDQEGLHRRHARTALGVMPDGDLILMIAAGVSKGAGQSKLDSQGASLLELADWLLKAGSVDALNLDGGGSAQAYFKGERVIVPGERRGLAQGIFERLVPSIGSLE